MEAASAIAPCYIAELPDELLVAIALQLHVERGFLIDREAERQRYCRNIATTRALRALVLVCSKFNAIATPVLYQAIFQTPHLYFTSRLFRTLFYHPKLAQHVRYLEFERLRGLKFSFSEAFSTSDYQRYQKLLLIKQHQPISLLLDDDPAEVGAAWLELTQSPFKTLLSMTENLQEAAIEANNETMWQLSSSRTSHPKRFRRLWLNKPTAIEDDRSICSFISSPHAPCGQLSRLLPYCYPSIYHKHNPPPAIMQQICIADSDIDPRYLDCLFQGCASLESFSCRWQWTDSSAPKHPVHLPALWQSLQRVRNTLTHLTIDTSESAWRVNLDRNIPALGSLREFNVLTYLEVAELVLWGDDDSMDPLPLASILPPSLETLVIKAEWDDDIEDALRGLSVDCATALPCLRKVECMWRPAPRTTACHLMKAFRLVGVDLMLDIEDDTGKEVTNPWDLAQPKHILSQRTTELT